MVLCDVVPLRKELPGLGAVCDLWQTQPDWRSVSEGRLTCPPNLSPLTLSRKRPPPHPSAPHTTYPHPPQLSHTDSPLTLHTLTLPASKGNSFEISLSWNLFFFVCVWSFSYLSASGLCHSRFFLFCLSSELTINTSSLSHW